MDFPAQTFYKLLKICQMSSFTHKIEEEWFSCAVENLYQMSRAKQVWQSTMHSSHICEHSTSEQ